MKKQEPTAAEYTRRAHFAALCERENPQPSAHEGHDQHDGRCIGEPVEETFSIGEGF